MPAFRKFEDIDAWKSARRLNQEVWELIHSGAFGRDFALADQMDRSAGSAMDNIAEGFDGGSDAEFIRFLRYAQRSCSEVESQLHRALDRDHIDRETFEALDALRAEVTNRTGGLIKYLKNSQ